MLNMQEKKSTKVLEKDNLPITHLIMHKSY